MTEIGVMQLIDSLEPGGAEMMAVNIANHLPVSRYKSHLCSSRRDGPLVELIAPHVHYLNLRRAHRFDLVALRSLVGYIKRHDIRILHAHETSLFIAVLVALLDPALYVIWHDHYGRCEVADRPAWFYRLIVHFAEGVIAVNTGLLCWAQEELKIPADRVWYVPNFVVPRKPANGLPVLPGEPGYRILSVANLRPEKGHLDLLQAMNAVVQRVPQAHLLIVGAVHNARYLEQMESTIRNLNLEPNVTLLGPRQDIPEILDAADVGVLSSHSEGLPLVLLEYGLARLPVVCTDVGQCRDVVDDGRAAILIPPRDPLSLANGLVQLLQSSSMRGELGNRLEEQISAHFSQEGVIDKIDQIYRWVLSSKSILPSTPT